MATCTTNPQDILPITTPTPIRRGFTQARCLKCGDTETLTIKLDDVGGEFTCSNCEETFSAEEVRDNLQAWAAVLAWIDAAPAVE